MRVDPGAHIRPDVSELAMLSRFGVLQGSDIFEGTIVLVMTHAVCREFYSFGPSPRLQKERRAEDEARVQRSMASETRADGRSRPRAQQRDFPFSDAVEAVHDPCHHETTVGQPSLNDILATPEFNGGIRAFDANRDTVASEELIRGLETRVLNLDELLVHKKSGIKKDRRIRALEQENKRCRRGEDDVRVSKRSWS